VKAVEVETASVVVVDICPSGCPAEADGRRLSVGNTHGSCCGSGVLAGHGPAAVGL